MLFHYDEKKQRLFEQAEELEQQGQEEKAFLAYLSMPGTLHLAYQLAQESPQEYLGILREQMPKVEHIFVKLVEGDLLLVLGQKEEALACFREVAVQINQFAPKDWQESMIPDDVYPVEPPMIERQLTRQERLEGVGSFKGILIPFIIGPGSHKDNWLIRRFIALDAWDEAAFEFERIWKIHQQQSALMRQLNQLGFDSRKRLNLDEVRQSFEKQQPHYFKFPDEIDQRTLQFAIDYAYFLTQRQQQETSLNILLTLLCLMDLDEEPYRESQYLNAHLSYKEFIRLAYGAFKEGGKENELIAALTQNIALGQNATRRILAQIRYHQGYLDEALALELAYLDHGVLDAITVAKRRGKVYEDAKKIAEAAQSYQQALIIASNQISSKKKNKETEDKDNKKLHNIFETLCRLYTALGQTDKMLETTLQQFEFQPKQFNNLSALEKAAQQFQAAGLSSQFFHWVTQQLSIVSHPKARANLFWLLGDYEKVLQSFDSQPELFLEFYSATIAQKLRQLNQEKMFLAWMRQKVVSMSDEYDQAELYWILRDYQAWAQVLAHKLTYLDDKCRDQRDQYCDWRYRVQRFGKSEACLFLEAILKVDPQNALVQFDWFQLEENPSIEVCIKTYEPLLEIELDSSRGFPFEYDYSYSDSIFNKKRFKDYYDLAYQLMLLYQQSGQWDKLHALGLRMVLQQKPFTNQDFENEWFLKNLNDCFSLLLQYADAELLDQLELLWRDYPNLPVKHQLARRKSGGFNQIVKLKKIFSWRWFPKLPLGTQLIVSHENVLSLSRDEKYIYAGHPWGIAVYDFQGQGVISIALEAAVSALAANDGFIWAGTAKGLFRIQREHWVVAYLRLNSDIPAEEFEEEFEDEDELEKKLKPEYEREEILDWYGNAVSSLVLEHGQLWIGLHRNVQRLDISQMTLQAYSKEELKIEREEEFYLILPNPDYVWVQSDSGMRRYDRQTDSWEKLDYQDNPIKFMTLLDSTLFGSVKVNENLGYRPCLIDQVSLEITPIFIEKRPGKVPEIDKPFCYLGTYQNQHVFSTEDIVYIYENKTPQLKWLGDLSEQPELMMRIKNHLQSGFTIEKVWWHADKTIVFNGYPNDDKILGQTFPTYRWAMLWLPDGTCVIGGKNPYSPIYECHDDLCHLGYCEEGSGSGGLYFLSPQGGYRRISAEDITNTMRGDIVFSVVDAHRSGETWLCTNYGISILDVNNQVINHLSCWDGLANNCVTAGFATKEGQLYFGGWNREKRSEQRMAFDPKTTMFITLCESEVLAEPVEKALHQAGERLERFLKLEFKDHQVMPYLGGFIITEQTVNGKTYRCGTRGVVIQKPIRRWLEVLKKLPRLTFKPPFLKWKKKLSFLKFPHLKVKLKQDLTTPNLKKGVEEAIERLFENCPANNLLALLEKSLQSDNPYYRAEAIAALNWRLTQLKRQAGNDDDEEEDDDEGYRGHREFVRYRKSLYQVDDIFLPLLINAAKDTQVRVRSTAFYVLISSDNHQTVMPVLREKLTDSDRYIRAVATVALAYRGELPPLKHIEEIFKVVRRRSRIIKDFGNYDDFPYGADSSQRTLVNFELTGRAIAPLANAEIFDLLFHYYPKCYRSFDDKKGFFRLLSKQLPKYPEVMERLLQVDPGRSSGYEEYHIKEYIQGIFEQVPAQSGILSVLHQSLTSPNRVVRSNAARACGTIGDPSSIRPLIQALDLESGLSRASIVWALGELKAQEALPDLIKLYIDVRHDEQYRRGRQRGVGYRFSQLSAATYSQYQALRTLSDVGTQWHELKAVFQPAVIEPQIDEELLSQQDILVAIDKIGAEHAQPFYQNLAGETDDKARHEAVIQLAKADSTYQKHNIQILQNFLISSEPLEVRTEAAVSLLILGDERVHKYILNWLANEYERYDIFQKLSRVKEASKLTFARKPLEAIVADPEMNEAKSLLENLRWARQMLAKMNKRPIYPIIKKPIIDSKLWVPQLPEAEGDYLGVLEVAADCIAISPDSRILATGSCDGKVRTWDLQTGKMLLESKEEHEGRIYDITMSPDGKHLATSSSDQCIRIWDRVTGRCLSCYEGSDAAIYTVSWSPDGKHLASVSKDYLVQIWDVQTGTCLHTIEDVGYLFCEWSPDGNLLAFYSRAIQIWEVARGKLLLDWLAGEVTSVTWSPDGRWLALAATDKTISVWDTQSWELVHQWEAHIHTKFASDLTWSPNSQLLASSGEFPDRHGISLWEPTTGRMLAQFIKKGKRNIKCPVWAPNGAFIAGCNRRDVIFFWDTRSYIQYN